VPFIDARLREMEGARLKGIGNSDSFIKASDR
jgi:hypothetical protein